MGCIGTIKGRNQLYTTHEALKDDPEAFTLWQDIDQRFRVKKRRVHVEHHEG